MITENLVPKRIMNFCCSFQVSVVFFFARTSEYMWYFANTLIIYSFCTTEQSCCRFIEANLISERMHFNNLVYSTMSEPNIIQAVRRFSKILVFVRRGNSKDYTPMCHKILWLYISSFYSILISFSSVFYVICTILSRFLVSY